MVALEVLLNGRRVCIAGAEDLATLTASLTVSGALGPKTVQPEPRDGSRAKGDGPRPHVRVGGLTCRGPGRDDAHLTWAADLAVKPGDTFSVRIVDVEASDLDAPARERPSEESMFDSGERQMFEIARETYFALRGKYGSSDV